MYVHHALKQLGLSHNEVALYLTLLSTGEGTITEIAKRAKLPRTTIHLVAEELQKKGLVAYFIKRRRHIWFAESPNNFLLHLRSKETLIQSILPALLLMQKQVKRRPTLTCYEDDASVEQILKEVIVSKYPIRIVGSMVSLGKRLGEDVAENFIQTLLAITTPVHIVTDQLVIDHLQQKKLFANQNKIITCEAEFLEDVLYIKFSNKVALILMGEQGSMGVVFDHKGLTNFSESLFKIILDTYS